MIDPPLEHADQICRPLALASLRVLWLCDHELLTQGVFADF